MNKFKDKNVKIYYIRAFIHNLLFFMPILTVFYLSLGLNLTEIFILNSFQTIISAIFTIPAGILADRFSRKKIHLLGLLIIIIPFIYYGFFALYFIEFLICEIFFGIGLTFMTMDVPFITNSLQVSGEAMNTKKVLANGNTIYILSLITGNLALLVLIFFGYRITFTATAIAFFVSFIIGAIYYEEKIPKKTQSISEFNKLAYHLKKTLSYCKKNQFLIYFIICGAIFMAFSWVGFWFVQPYYLASDLPVQLFGLLFLITNLGEGLISKLSGNIDDKLKRRNVILLMNLLYIISYIGMAFVFNLFAVLFVLLRQFGYGLTVPLFMYYINEEISELENQEDKIELQKYGSSRATAYSIYVMFYMGVFAIISPIFGFLADYSSLTFVSVILSIIMLIVLIINIVIYKKMKISS